MSTMTGTGLAQSPRPPKVSMHSNLSSNLPGKPSHNTIGISPATKPQMPSKLAMTPEELAKLKASAVISAAPVVRDLKKEATKFVPSAVKRKRPLPSTSGSNKKVVKPQQEEGYLGGSQELGSVSPGSAQSIEDRTIGPEAHDNEREASSNLRGVALPPGFERALLRAYPDANEVMGDEERKIMPSAALPPGFSARKGLSRFEDDEGSDAEDLGEDQGPARPPNIVSQYSYDLPGMESEEEVSRRNKDDDVANFDVQGPALPMDHGGFENHLPGFSDDEDEEELGDIQEVARPSVCGEEEQDRSAS